ncbi:hypothetical protein C8J57DRAFT_1526991 [Mycena rebaudengoi]|nr:hypothetical protein C8J57DRAFT_1526991 [Mycena rebaudengoi]
MLDLEHSPGPPPYEPRRPSQSDDSELADLIASLEICQPSPVPAPIASSRTPTTTYVYQSPARQGVTADWSLAGSASQGVPHGHVHTVQKKVKKPRRNAGAYVVFHGIRPAVCSTWAEAKALTSGVSNSIHRSYRTLTEANAAFQYAQDRGWTRSCNSQSPAAAIRVLPIPMIESDSANPLHGDDVLDNQWFVVYRGITPGVYQSLLEALLNTTGISASVYEGIEGRSEANLKFQGAVERGDVSALAYRRRAELKTRSQEEQELYAERARASQAKYREKHRDHLAREQGRRRLLAYGAVNGVPAMNAWAKKMSERRERQEGAQEKKARRLRREARWAAKTAAGRPPPKALRKATPSDSEPDESDDNPPASE